MKPTVTLLTALLLPLAASAQTPPLATKTIVTVSASTPELPRKSEGDVIELKDGRLLLISMEFGGDGNDFATTRLVAHESADGGLTWGGHRVITETAPGDINVYAPNLIRAQDGGVLLFFHRNHAKDTGKGASCTLYAWKSADEGRTFAPFAEFFPLREHSLCNATVKRLKSGRLLLPVNPAVPGDHGPYGKYAVTVLFSDDDGRTWTEAANRLTLPKRGAMEGHVEQAGDGRVLMVMRNQLGTLHLSESTDDGLHWSEPKSIGLASPESCPELTRIPSTGDLLMIWNHSFDPKFRSHYGKRSPLTAAVSKDHGRTWQHLRDIETDPKRAFSNPGCRFTRDGRAILNYWTCEYLPDWRIQDIIDLRVAVIDTAWFYGASVIPPTSDADQPIAIQNPLRLPPDPIPCERIAVGEPDDYKPCIARMPDGELLMTAFHQHKREGRKVMEQILLFRSKDGGKTWSAPEKLDLLGREPYLTVLPDGTVFITVHLLSNDVRNEWGYTCGFLHRSTDRGRTWESIRIESEVIKPKANNTVSRNVLRHHDGTLLLGVDYHNGGPCFVWRSTDNGKTWDKTQTCVPKGFRTQYGFFGGETWLWQAKTGKIWALVRVDSREFPISGKSGIKSNGDQSDHFILYASTDGAKTFDCIRDFGDYGEMYMSLLRLQDSRLLLTFTVRDLSPPLGVRAIPGVETDDGFEFDFTHDRILLDVKTGSRYQGGGFSPTVQLDDGTLVTACSYRAEDDKTRLEVIRWKLPVP